MELQLVEKHGLGNSVEEDMKKKKERREKEKKKKGKRERDGDLVI